MTTVTEEFLPKDWRASTSILVVLPLVRMPPRLRLRATLAASAITASTTPMERTRRPNMPIILFRSPHPAAREDCCADRQSWIGSARHELELLRAPAIHGRTTTLSLAALLALRGAAHDLGYAHAELVVDDDDLASGDERAV